MEQWKREAKEHGETMLRNRREAEARMRQARASGLESRVKELQEIEART